MVSSCAPEAIIDINTLGFRQDNDLHIRVSTLNRVNEVHPMCVDRDSSEAVLRYTAPPENASGPQVLALRATTATCATEYDTVLAIRNGCGPDYTDYTCNNDGWTPDGLDTRKSTAYFLNVEPEQYVYIVLDGFDNSAGQAEVDRHRVPAVGRSRRAMPPDPHVADERPERRRRRVSLSESRDSMRTGRRARRHRSMPSPVVARRAVRSGPAS